MNLYSNVSVLYVSDNDLQLGKKPERLTSFNHKVRIVGRSSSVVIYRGEQGMNILK